MKKDNYDDIINLPHHVSRKHPCMDMQSRAAQFSPFAALTGYESAIKEMARLTDEKIELGEADKARLDEMLMRTLNEKNAVSITYFVPDERKNGGRYVTDIGHIKKADMYKRKIIMDSGREISVNDIYSINLLNDMN